MVRDQYRNFFSDSCQFCHYEWAAFVCVNQLYRVSIYETAEMMCRGNSVPQSNNSIPGVLSRYLVQIQRQEMLVVIPTHPRSGGPGKKNLVSFRLKRITQVQYVPLDSSLAKIRTHLQKTHEPLFPLSQFSELLPSSITGIVRAC